MPKYLTTCVSCHGVTSRVYSRAHEGRCKGCETGVAPIRRKGRSHDDICREGGYEDTMGCSPDVLEGRYDDGDYDC